MIMHGPTCVYHSNRAYFFSATYDAYYHRKLLQ